ncbi:P-loop containing nucleoside triphosphate hydrolase protein [Multifurca ochricompacta]|uniref:ATP-dependent RNA helicase n=1 Tax=Multifurca ochricompacta TaxID=376703 RepID=A0AAD4M3Y6_9AGAM|nr:P-loop containing nucleoside triphosphate hydrolase protein [Multifurca ochricompacta]
MRSSDVLDVLLKLCLRPLGAAPNDEEKNDSQLTRWLVSGLLTGGATRVHEKARIRKGIPILVATPGHLLGHLQNTSSLDTSKCRWLVLDEADRLMDLGFADAIKGILACLDGSRKLALQAVKDGRTMEVLGWDWDVKRRTILCSATMREDVQVLAGTALHEHDPFIIKATELDLPKQETTGTTEDATASATDPKFTPPSQLSQKYIIVPLKLCLGTLVALLRSLLSQSGGRRGFKIIVFLSCADSVDFHLNLLGGSNMEDDSERTDSDDETAAATVAAARTTGVHSPLLPDTSIFRLHGSLPLSTRLASLRAFSATNKTSESSDRLASVLLCTSVAARGLDLPRVRAVVQYDLPTEGGATEYVHRVGRTARAGCGGQARAIIAPSEEKWVEWVQARMASGTTTTTTTEESSAGAGHQFEAVAVEEILQKGFSKQGREYEERATEVQLTFERWCLQRKQNVEMARKAFASHLRAYATHPSDEKHIFHIRHLHLGRMRAVVRSQGRLIKKGGLWRAQAHQNSKSRLGMHWRGWLTGLDHHEHGQLAACLTLCHYHHLTRSRDS